MERRQDEGDKDQHHPRYRKRTGGLSKDAERQNPRTHWLNAS